MFFDESYIVPNVLEIILHYSKVALVINDRKSTFYRFVTIRKSIVYKLRNKRRPFAMQKSTF